MTNESSLRVNIGYNTNPIIQSSLLSDFFAYFTIQGRYQYCIVLGYTCQTGLGNNGGLVRYVRHHWLYKWPDS